LSGDGFCGDVPGDDIDVDVVSIGVESQTFLDLEACGQLPA